jgi:thioesterase domain-containing protein
VVSFAEVAAELGSDQPVFGLQSLGLDGVSAPLTRVEDIAAYFIGEVRTLQPAGPYRFAGQCMGGVIALEMAQQLQARGEQVELLVLIETWPPAVVAADGRLAPRSPLQRFVARCAAALEMLINTDPEQRLVLVRQKASILARLLLRREPRDAAEIARARVERANYQAFTRYRPNFYGGSIRLVLAEGRELATAEDPRLHWRKKARSCEVYSMPGRDSGVLFHGHAARQLARYLAPDSAVLGIAMVTSLCS